MAVQSARYRQLGSASGHIDKIHQFFNAVSYHAI
jgi:hypothetical protein